jgi:uncharacterized protein YbcC (UPF0753/DUF2309 family)
MINENLNEVILKSCKRIAPAWPLKNSVAVNPYLGLSEYSFNSAAKLLKERSDINMTMPLEFYLDQIKQQSILDLDIKMALDKYESRTTEINVFKNRAQLLSRVSETPYKFTTIVDIAEKVSSSAINEFFVDLISSWASAYFDEHQALWNTTNPDEDLFISWKNEAKVDLSTDLMGIKKFRSTIKQLPDDSFEVAQIVLDKLNVPKELREIYLHTLLLKLVGWSSFIAGKDWNNSMYGGKSTNLSSFLSVLLAWELGVYESFAEKGITATWDISLATYQRKTESGRYDEHLETKLILQNAYDFALQRQLVVKFKNNKAEEKALKRPKAQAVFCIDVRSELYRRNLEKVDPEIETIGFAGFFGFSINYVPIAHKHGKNQCPVLIPTAAIVKEALADKQDLLKAEKKRTEKHQFDKNWKLFRKGAIASFGFVSPLGLSYLPKLLSDSFGWTRPTDDPNTDGLEKFLKKGRDVDVSEIPLRDKINMGASALTAMGLKEQMAALIMITGHGATTVNNPHATGLDCGACGGHSGEINAMTAEKILNDPAVRLGLSEKGVSIPSDTHFVACLHDTTTDEISILGERNVPSSHVQLLKEIKNILKYTSQAAREERALRMKIKSNDVNTSVLSRSKDWSQVRPEWGLAGCNTFVVAPRYRTSGLDFEGKSFLHSYKWQADEDFKILEAIMTAPMVVTSWINLQYFASTADNDKLGAGNKTLHNVSGGIGVLEGSTGDLRIGLPLQSLHDGTSYQHLPQRLNVVVEAPTDAINGVLEKHGSIRELCDNEWITLLALDENGTIKYRYVGKSNWEAINRETPSVKKELVEL